jgi:hypothetical protein
MLGNFGGHRLRTVRVEDAAELPEQVKDWQIGYGTALGETVRFAVPERLPAHAAAEFLQ